MTYLSGYLQRDVSIGNVLVTEQPVKREAFNVPEEFPAHLSSLEDEWLVAKIRALCNRVEQLVGELGISDECIGFITDGDLTISWEDCFSKENQETQSVSHSQIFSKLWLTKPVGHTRICVTGIRDGSAPWETLPTLARG